MSAAEKQQQEARRLAMLRAIETAKSGETKFCSTCASLEARFACENRRSCQEIQHLRQAVQKMVDQLAAYMSVANLHAFATTLRLDERLFTIPDQLDAYRTTPFPIEGQVTRKDVEQVTAERDIAKMKLSVMSKELKELQAAHESLKDTRGAELNCRVEALEKSIMGFADLNRAALAPACIAATYIHEDAASITGLGIDCTAALRAPSSAAHRQHKLSGKTRDAIDDFDMRRLVDAESNMKSLEKLMNSAPCSNEFGKPSKKSLPMSVGGKFSQRSQPNLWSLGPPLASEKKTALPVTCFPGLASPQRQVLSRGRSSGLITLKTQDLPGRL